MEPDDDDFERRREEWKARINGMDRATTSIDPRRGQFFDAIYEQAGGDAAVVPWADLRPKDRLASWVAANPGKGRTAVDVACGLGDNAEAIAAAGYRTTAFDGSPKAIDWVKRRFPDSAVDYQVADLLHAPGPWLEFFDLVHECYTIQSVPPQLHDAYIRAISRLVRPGGLLLVYTRTRPASTEPDGPPWPLTLRDARRFAEYNFECLSEELFDLVRSDRSIPHAFSQWRRL